MDRRVIISLAILQVNFDRARRDYLENFVPMVAECIRLMDPDVVSLPELTEDFANRFGLALPQHVMDTILRRVCKRGYAARSSGTVVPARDKLAELNFGAVRARVIRMHEEVAEALVVFARERYGIQWESNAASTALDSYLERHQLDVPRLAVRSEPLPVEPHKRRRVDYVVAKFVQYLHETGSGLFSYVDTVAKGNMLMQAMFLPDPVNATRRFQGTAVYFDTSFLMSALGYAGPSRSQPCLELIELLYETGAELRCFSHTLEEMRGSLHAWMKLIEEGRLAEGYGQSADYFMSAGHTASDVIVRVHRLPRDLGGLRVRVVDTPDYGPEENHRYVIYEKGLQEALEDQVHFSAERTEDSRKRATWRDVQSISAIQRLRRGKHAYLYEDCRALFVTSNKSMQRVCYEFFRVPDSEDVVPPCVTDQYLTTLLWLKKPLDAPDLPRKCIIADCYASTQPTDALWRRYLDKISEEEASGRCAADDVFALRYGPEARRQLMEFTQGDEDAITDGTVAEILARVKEKEHTALNAELSEKDDALRAAKAETETLVKRVDDEGRRLKSKATRWASAGARVLRTLLVVGLVAAVAASLTWPPLKGGNGGSVPYVIAFLFLFLLGYTAWDFWTGRIVNALIRRIEVRLSRRIEHVFLHMLGRE